MISRIKKLKMPIIVYGFGSNPSNIINWGTRYYSKKGESDKVPKEFTIYFPKTPVLIKGCKIMASGDVFPDDFSLFVSNDNKTFKNIIKNRTSCNPSDITVKQHAKYCKSNSIMYIEASIRGHFYFVKFTMQTNTYYFADKLYDDLITFNGIEFIGDFCNKRCSSRITNHHLYYVFVLIFLLVIS